MAWDFSTDLEFQEKLDWVEQFCREQIEPLTLAFPAAGWPVGRPPAVDRLVDGLKDQVKEQGLWGIFLDKDIGGPGFGQLKLALLNEILGAYGSAPAIFGCQAPDTGNMEILATYGTEEQKQKYLQPLFAQKMRSCYSMTEPQGGSDPRAFVTHAERDGDEWVINGEKWFSSYGKFADILIVMCNNGMFIVEKGTPGIEFLEGAGIHAHIRYNDVRIPAENLLGPEGGAHQVAQRRLGGGRIHHAMRTVATVKKAFDMMCERVISRSSHGKVIAEHQSVQNYIADSYAEYQMLRLLVLQTALEDRQLERPGGPHRHRRVQVHRGQGRARGRLAGAARARRARRHRPHSPAGHVEHRADDEHHGRARRGAPRHGVEEHPRRLHAARGPVPHRVPPAEATRSAREVPTAHRLRPRAQGVRREDGRLRQPAGLSLGILDGRRIVLTGGASGMGAASVRSFAREGARVFSMDIDADGGARVAEEAAALGGDVLFEHCDVGSPQLDDVMERGIAWLGGLDVLANVAGIERGATPQDVTEDEFEETLEPNLWATIHANQIACRHMQEAGGGRIINYASAAGLGGMPMAPAYSVSKGGVLGWTRSIARGVGRLQHHRGGDVPGDLDADVRGLPPPRTGGDGGDVGPDVGRHRRRSRHGPGDGVPGLNRCRRDHGPAHLGRQDQLLVLAGGLLGHGDARRETHRGGRCRRAARRARRRRVHRRRRFGRTGGGRRER